MGCGLVYLQKMVAPTIGICSSSWSAAKILVNWFYNLLQLCFNIGRGGTGNLASEAILAQRVMSMLRILYKRPIAIVPNSQKMAIFSVTFGETSVKDVGVVQVCGLYTSDSTCRSNR